jgi:thiamine biosynthesis lipoprotein
MKKIILIIALIITFVLTGCQKKDIKVWQQSYYEYFNTVSTIMSYKDEEVEQFTENLKVVKEVLWEYHQLFDIYYEYSGVNNLATINRCAGQDPIQVDQKLIDFLLYAKEIYGITKGETNVMLGSVLKLWHDARTVSSANPNNAYVPDMTLLEEANLHTSIDLLEIDDENNTVRISDPMARIDVGALGKGYATEKLAQILEEKGCYGYVLNIGGNLRIIGTKPDGTGWNTGIKNPLDRSKYSLYLNISNISCVTSGDYERYFTYEGKKYHHLIDKDTLMPSNYFSSVTILVNDSGLADALSTALFSMSYEEGKSLVEKIGNVDVVWIYTDGTVIYTDGITPIDL